MKILLFLFLLCSAAYAGTFEVTTGYGYFRDGDGNVVARANLPVGTHPIKDGYTYVEADNEADMTAVALYVPPETPEQKTARLTAEKEAILKDATEAMLNEDAAAIADAKARLAANATAVSAVPNEEPLEPTP